MMFNPYRNIWQLPYTQNVYDKIYNIIATLRIKTEAEAVAKLRMHFHADAIRNVFNAITSGDVFGNDAWSDELPQIYPSPTWQDWLTIVWYTLTDFTSYFMYPIGAYFISAFLINISLIYHADNIEPTVLAIALKYDIFKIFVLEDVLIYAAHGNNSAAVHELLSSRQMSERSKALALEIAVDNKNLNIAQDLLQQHASITKNALMLAIAREDFSIIKALLECKPNIEWVNEILKISYMNYNFEITSMILEQHPDFSAAMSMLPNIHYSPQLRFEVLQNIGITEIPLTQAVLMIETNDNYYSATKCQNDDAAQFAFNNQNNVYKLLCEIAEW